MKVRCVGSDLIEFTPNRIYKATSVGLDSFMVGFYYAEEGWDGLIKLDGYETQFEIVEDKS